METTKDLEKLAQIAKRHCKTHKKKQKRCISQFYGNANKTCFHNAAQL